MHLTRISCIEPPEEMRSKWVREILTDAIEQGLTPATVSSDRLVSFSVALPTDLANALDEKSSSLNRPVAEIAAGLIESARVRMNAHPSHAATPHEGLVGESLVNSGLQSLAEATWSAVRRKKIAFAEAATSAGNGMMLASLAATAVAQGQKVVVSAPFSVTWQLIEELAAIPEALSSGLALLLTRADVVSPLLLRQWATDRKNQELLDWIDEGGKPRDERAINAGRVLGIDLGWLLEDALEVAGNIPVESVTLETKIGAKGCPAVKMYEAVQSLGAQASIQICSHAYLASHVQQLFLGATNNTTASQAPIGGLLPPKIDLLLIHEAHLLEQAISAMFEHEIYFSTVAKALRTSTIPRKRAAIEQIDKATGRIYELLKELRSGDRRDQSAATGRLADFEGLHSKIRDLDSALEGLKPRNKDYELRATIEATRKALMECLTNHSTVRLERSSLSKYPHIVVGKGNLETPLGLLWDQVGAAALVSATLYTDGAGGNLTRWKLHIPKERAEYLQPIHPEWISRTVLYRNVRTSIPPNDSSEWAAETVAQVRQIAANASGGTLVLCTSKLNAKQIADGLAKELDSRLIIQSQNASVSGCAARYRAMYLTGARPVWIATGAAWNEPLLSDVRADSTENNMVSDLVIPRLPLRLNRSLSHQRRVAMMGDTINLQEANLHFRQGVIRLIWNVGAGPKNLWVLDCRLDQKKPWAAGFNKTLSLYQSEPRSRGA